MKNVVQNIMIKYNSVGNDDTGVGEGGEIFFNTIISVRNRSLLFIFQL